jgi:hypothetical protein
VPSSLRAGRGGRGGGRPAQADLAELGGVPTRPRDRPRVGEGAIEGVPVASGGVAWAAGTNDVVRIQPVGSA